MPHEIAELLLPRILIVDDERPIQASLRLRLSKLCDLTFCLNATEALEIIGRSQFDVCFVDIQMPGMNGLEFIEAAQQRDSALGHVVLSAFDSPENLRRVIPLQVYDFLTKPFPPRDEFEFKIPEWVARTRHQRSEQKLAQGAATITRSLQAARQERDIEFLASETARDALLQTSNLLTTINAHLAAALPPAHLTAKADPSLKAILRNLEIARKTADAATAVADGFFNSAYGNRDLSPAIIDTGISSGIQIARRMTEANAANKLVDYSPSNERIVAKNLSGIELLLMLVPVIAAALRVAEENTTIGINVQPVARLDSVFKTQHFEQGFWVNRKNALLSHPGVIIQIIASSTPPSRTDLENWLHAETGPLESISSRGLAQGIKKCQGLLGFSLPPKSDRFRLCLTLPV